MSRLTDLLAQAKMRDPTLGQELEREFRVLSSRLSFGLNFERHPPESVELPGRPIRKGDKVRVLPPRGSTDGGDQLLWRVLSVTMDGGARVAELERLDRDASTRQQVNTEDLAVVAEFMDHIFPGLVSTGKVKHGGDKPFHTVINAENFHALEALTFTHRSKIDAIYIDPPYNSGARDWKYNNDYVESEDLYRHSKWLAMMERRLIVAKQLLNPNSSVLIVTIDEKEIHRIALLLEQIFPEGNSQTVAVVINPQGTGRINEFSRTHEYIIFVMLGEMQLRSQSDNV
jgi:adenine-specific DNA-methyltransferase